MVSIKALLPYENNTRNHTDEDIDAIVASIKQFGFSDPIGVWGENNLIVEGHGRLAAANKLGMEQVPCIRLDHLSEEQRIAYAIAHNRTAELSEWNEDTLEKEIENIRNIDMGQFGFMQKSELPDYSEMFVDDDNDTEKGKKKMYVCPHCGSTFER